MKSLCELLSSHNQWAWKEVFQEVKSVLASIKTLNVYDPLLSTVVSADTLSFGLVADVCQTRSGRILKPPDRVHL